MRAPRGRKRAISCTLMLLLLLSSGATIAPLCTGGIGTDGVVDTYVDFARVAVRQTYRHSGCIPGKALDGCCREFEGKPCMEDMVQDAACCQNPLEPLNNGAVIVFAISGQTPFSSAVLRLHHSCAEAENGICSPEGKVKLYYCSFGSCGIPNVREACIDYSLGDTGTGCTGDRCLIERDVSDAVAFAHSSGWLTILFHLEAFTPTHYYTWPSLPDLPCSTAGGECTTVDSAPFTGVHLLTTGAISPELIIERSCSDASDCHPSDTADCIDIVGDPGLVCSSCEDSPGATCKDEEGRTGRCCGEECAIVPGAVVDMNSNGVLDSGVDGCGSGKCISAYECITDGPGGPAWRCASEGKQCCGEGDNVYGCDDAGDCTAASGVQSCNPNICMAGSCSVSCDTDGDCASGFKCVSLEAGKKACKKSCASSSGCSASYACLDANDDGSLDVCDTCKVDGVRCDVTTGTGYCCDGLCRSTSMSDNNGDHLLNSGDTCGSGSCSGKVVCGSNWVCSSEGVPCCDGPGSKGKCSEGSCGSGKSCGPYPCTNGICSDECSDSDDCRYQTTCLDRLGSGTPSECGWCTDNTGAICVTVDGALGRCCGGSCGTTMIFNGACETDCQCESGHSCKDPGVCKRATGTSCDDDEQCTSDCCADGMCLGSQTVALGDVCSGTCQCEGGLTCAAGLCRSGLGRACTFTTDCASGCCANARCVPNDSVVSGDMCRETCECGTGHSCVKEFITDESGLCLATTGGTCSLDKDCATSCCAAAMCVPRETVDLNSTCSNDCQCSLTMECAGGKCLKKVGVACDSGEQCGSGVCKGSTCRERGEQTLAQSCRIDNDCISGLECTIGTCLRELGTNATGHAECVSGCASKEVCTVKSSVSLDGSCSDDCACEQGLKCNNRKGTCLRDLAGYCLNPETCASDCCVENACAVAGGVPDSESCLLDCQCASGICAAGTCRAARPCITREDCDMPFCADGLCKDECGPEGAPCDTLDSTGYCCDGKCIGLGDKLGGIPPYTKCGMGPCIDSVRCVGGSWRCGPENSTCCDGDGLGSCSTTGVCIDTFPCPGSCDGNTAQLKDCMDGACVDAGTRDCSTEMLFCRAGSCGPCLIDGDCARYNKCEGTLHIGYACIGGTCEKRDRECSDSYLVCEKDGCMACTSTEACAAQYGEGKQCEPVSGACRVLKCTNNDNCPNLCEDNVFVPFVCDDFLCKKGEDYTCKDGTVCTTSGCSGCESDVVCIIDYGLGHTCIEKRCVQTCIDGVCRKDAGENCLWCPDCRCSDGNLCDPMSDHADEGGCVSDMDDDSIPDQIDPDPQRKGFPCLNDDECPTACQGALALKFSCLSERCVVSNIKVCQEQGQVCERGLCVPCTAHSECTNIYGPLHICSQGTCRRDIDGDGVPDGDEECPREPDRRDGCPTVKRCNTLIEDCRTGPGCACDGPLHVCDPHRTDADSTGCVGLRCGDSICDRPTENEGNCCQDCGCIDGKVCDSYEEICKAGCGDGICASQECSFCSRDCAPIYCANGVCDTAIGESCAGSEDCTCSVSIDVMGTYDVMDTPEIDVPVQVANIGNVPDSYFVRINTVNARLGFTEVQIPTLKPNGKHAFLLPLTFLSSAGTTDIDIVVTSETFPELATAGGHVTITFGSSNALIRAIQESFLWDIITGKNIPGLAIIGLSIVIVLVIGAKMVFKELTPRTVATVAPATSSVTAPSPYTERPATASYYGYRYMTGEARGSEASQGWDGQSQ